MWLPWFRTVLVMIVDYLLPVAALCYSYTGIRCIYKCLMLYIRRLQFVVNQIFMTDYLEEQNLQKNVQMKIFI